MAVLRAMAMLRYGALSAVLQPYIAIARTLSWANRNVRRHRERKGCQQHRLSHHPHVLNKSKLCGGLGHFATLGAPNKRRSRNSYSQWLRRRVHSKSQLTRHSTSFSCHRGAQTHSVCT